MALTPDEQTMIRGLFERIRAQSNGPRDVDAERLIADEVSRNPASAYVMTQTILMQEEALKMSEARARELEAELNRLRAAPAQQAQSGGFLSGFRQPAPQPSGPWGGAPAQARGPWGNQPQQPQAMPPQGMPPQAMPWGGQQQPAQSGGFMRSALATAAGVAGGAMLFSGLSNMFGGGSHGNSHGALDQNAAGNAATPGDLTANFGGDARSNAYDNSSYDSASADDFSDGGDSGGDWA